MSYVTCPNCRVSLASAVAVDPPTTCPNCCASLHLDDALSRPAPHKAARASSFDRVILSGRDAPGVARREFRVFAGHLGKDIESTGSLLVSEMVTNAVQHGPAETSSTIALHCALVGERLQVEIGDDGTGFVPPERTERQDAGSGWGLHLIDSLATTWGVDSGRPTRVWFELAL